jgi:hypothetical protein
MSDDKKEAARIERRHLVLMLVHIIVTEVYVGLNCWRVIDEVGVLPCNPSDESIHDIENR